VIRVEPFGTAVRHGIVRDEEVAGSVAKPDEQVGLVLSFDDVYREHRMPLTRLARVITGSNAVAEELVQEAFVRLHQRWQEVRNPPGFLRAALTNLCRSYLRRARLERLRAPRPAEQLGEPVLDETWAAVCRLPFRQRAVLALRYYADLPEGEVAAVLGCSLGTVKSARHRAIARLRRELT
jgi:RNA polymerase sigma-70 factor (sigma-E family)